MYKEFETRTSYKYLKEVINSQFAYLADGLFSFM